MKKLLCLMLACILCGSFVFTACGTESTEKASEATQSEAASGEVTQADIEKKIIGSWIITERDGQPALTNEKGIFTFVSPTEAYISASFNARPEMGDYWMNMLEAEAEINENKATITRKGNDEATMVDEVAISNITDGEIQGSLVVKSIEDGKEEIITEESIRFEKIDADYSKDILGTWEGHCTSEGSVFDDGQEHRWEYKSDGSYVYYVKDGDNWVPSANTMNEYFVTGNLLCTRWMEGGEEYREWWEISIDGNTMKWTALREDEEGKTFTASFEMNMVEED